MLARLWIPVHSMCQLPPWFFLLPTCVNGVKSDTMYKHSTIFDYPGVLFLCVYWAWSSTCACVVCGFKVGRKEIAWVCICSNALGCEQDKTMSNGREVTSLPCFSHFEVWLERVFTYIPMSRWCWLLYHLQCILTFIIHCMLGHASHSAAFR